MRVDDQDHREEAQQETDDLPRQVRPARPEGSRV